MDDANNKKTFCAVGLTVVVFVALVIGLIVFAALPAKKNKLIYRIRTYEYAGTIRVEGTATALSMMHGVRVEIRVIYVDGEETICLELGHLERGRTVTIDTAFPASGAYKTARVVDVHVQGAPVKPIGMAACGVCMAGLIVFWVVYAVRRSRRTCGADVRAQIDQAGYAGQLVELWPEQAERLFSDPTSFDRLETAMEEESGLPLAEDGAYNDFLFLIEIMAIRADGQRALFAAARNRMTQRLYERMGEERAAKFQKAGLKKKLAFYASLPFSGEEQWKTACFYAVYDAFTGTSTVRYAQFLHGLGDRNA